MAQKTKTVVASLRIYLPSMNQSPVNLTDPRAIVVRQTLLDGRRVVLTTHRNPDGDAIGSVMGLHHLLVDRGLEVHTILPDPAPRNLRWLIDHAPTDRVSVWSASSGDVQLLTSADVIVVCDLNTLSRLGTGESDLGTAIRTHGMRDTCQLINIDHHVEPEEFTTHQWIDTDAPAVCSMLCELFFDLSVPAATAKAWYTGLMTDTGSFRFPRTTQKTFLQAAWLVEHGADPVEAYERVINANTFQRELLLGSALHTMQRYANDRLCVMSVRTADLERTGSDVEDTEGFVHHTLSIEGVDMGVLVVELPHCVKISFRSKGSVYVRDLAATFGGGGHVYAAGARVFGSTFNDVLKLVVDRASALL